ncbi:MAG TPA: hypothetical protein VMP08_06500, partial [Anaerolineae bacterium]|nr:hypothetical protein [Anaerolineae bacterium]
GATLKWLDNYQKGRFEVYVDTSELSRSVDKFNISTERLMVGMILAGMLIGGAIAMVAVPQTEIGVSIKLATFAIFAIAAGLGLWLTLRILWRTFGEERRLSGDKNPWK